MTKFTRIWIVTALAVGAVGAGLVLSGHPYAGFLEAGIAVGMILFGLDWRRKD